MTTSPQPDFPYLDTLVQQVQAVERQLRPWIEQATGVLGRTADAIANIPLVHWATGIPGLSWLLAALGQVNQEKVQQDIAQLRQQHPFDTPEQLVQKVIQQSAWRGAQVGLLTNLVPSVALTLLAVDIGAIAALQAQMIYRIAAIYGFSPEDPTRRGEVLALWFVTSTSSNLIKTGLSLPEAIPGIGTAIGIATDASLLVAVGWLANRFYAAKQTSFVTE